MTFKIKLVFFVLACYKCAGSEHRSDDHWWREQALLDEFQGRTRWHVGFTHEVFQ